MQWFGRLPTLFRVIIFLGASELIVFITDIVTGFVKFRGPLILNLTICTLVLLQTRMFLRIERLSWSGAGLHHFSVRQLLMGAITGVGMLLAVASVTKWLIGFQWAMNPAFPWVSLPAIFLTVFCSAFAQELAFRGYPFFLMLHKWGEWPAQMVTAFFFGCMHLHEGMSLAEVLLTLFNTGIGSILFGMATIRTGKIYLAAGIHFGWNLLQQLLPRIPGENGGIWLVTGEHISNLKPVAYVVPYVIVVILVYLIIRWGKPVTAAT